MVEVAVERVGCTTHPTDAGADGAHPGTLGEQLLNAVLGIVIEFVTAGSEHLDAVVGHRVVRRGDHHAEVSIVGRGEIGHCWSRQYADPQYVDTFTCQPGDHRGLKHLAARSRVATNDGDATNRPTFGAAGPRCGEAPGRGRAESKNQLCGQFAVGDASHTIGPE